MAVSEILRKLVYYLIKQLNFTTMDIQRINRAKHVLASAKNVEDWNFARKLLFENTLITVEEMSYIDSTGFICTLF